MADWGHFLTTEHLLPTTVGESKASPRPSVHAHITTIAEDYSSMVTITSPHSTKAETSKASVFSIFYSKRNSMVCTYAFTIVFITCTILLVFNPSRPSVHFGFKNFLHVSSYSSSQTPNPHWKRDSLPHFDVVGSLKGDVGIDQKGFKIGLNQSSGENGGTKENVEIERDDHIGTAQSSNTTILSLFKDSNHTGAELTEKVEVSERRNETKKAVSSHSSSNGKKGLKKKGSDSKKGLSKKQGKQSRSKLKNECDLFDGKWVRDNSYPIYAAGTCPWIDEPFDCFLNGRPDNGYEKYRWQPKHCNVPR